MSLILLAAGMCLQAAEVKVEQGDGRASVTFRWTAPMHCDTSVDGRELLLRCPSAVEIGETEEQVKQAPNWIENISAGFDTILLRAARDVEYQVTQEEKGLLVAMSPAAERPGRDAPADNAAKIRLELIRVQALVQSGKEAQALAVARSLAAMYPGDPRVLAELAGLESERNRQRRAWQLFERAQNSDPDNREVAESASQFTSLRSPSVQLDYDYRNVENALNEQVSSLTAQTKINVALDAGIKFDSDAFSYDGQAGVRTRGEAYLGYEGESGTTLRGSLFEGAGHAGAGVKLARPDDTGRTGLDLTYRQPYWEFPETLTGNGVRGRSELWREQNLLPNLTGRIAGGVNRYGLSGLPEAARSLFLQANLGYRVLRKPNIVIEYGLDAEHRSVLTTLPTGDGGTFAPLPLVSREVHLVSATLSRRIRRGLDAEGYGGYAVDRLGGRAPFFGTRLTLKSERPLGAQIFFDRRLYYFDTAQSDTRVGGYLYWRF